VLEGLPPMLCGDQMIFLRPQAIERLEFPSLKTSPWLAADWLGEVAAPPILVNAHLYFSTRTRGLLAAGPGD
jgi:hypothetical protein